MISSTVQLDSEDQEIADAIDYVISEGLVEVIEEDGEDKLYPGVSRWY